MKHRISTRGSAYAAIRGASRKELDAYNAMAKGRALEHMKETKRIIGGVDRMMRTKHSSSIKK